MGKSDIPELVEALIDELKKQGLATNVCSAGLTSDQVQRVDGWTKDDGFTDNQMEALKNFADAIRKAKRWIAIGIGIIAIITLRDLWMDILNWFKEHLLG